MSKKNDKRGIGAKGANYETMGEHGTIMGVEGVLHVGQRSMSKKSVWPYGQIGPKVQVDHFVSIGAKIYFVDYYILAQNVQLY